VDKKLKKPLTWIIVIAVIAIALYVSWLCFLKPLIAKLLRLLGFVNFANKLLSVPGAIIKAPVKAVEGVGKGIAGIFGGGK